MANSKPIRKPRFKEVKTYEQAARLGQYLAQQYLKKQTK
jgi:hypothetical protein